MPLLQKLTKPVIVDLVTLLAGALLTLAFAPYSLVFFALLPPAWLLLSWLNVSPSRGAWRGWLFGMGFFGTGVSWVYISIHTYGNTDAPLAALFTLLFIGILSLFYAVQGYALARCFPRNNATKLLLAFPALGVACEWLRSTVLSGFPWLLLGNSHLNSPLQGYAPLVGVYGVTFISLWVVGITIYSLKTRRYLISLAALVLVATVGAVLTQVSWSTPKPNPLKISLLQGNIAQSLKWDPRQLFNTLKVYQQLVESQLGQQLIVLPEAAIPVALDAVEFYVEELATKVKRHHGALLVGVPIQDPANGQYYNALVAYGEGSGTYHKRHLVPFGEYLPFDSLLRGLINFFDIPMSSFHPGAQLQANLRVGSFLVAPFICYEIAFPSLIYQALPEADLLLSISDDSWFGESNAPAQHLEIARMRALETGRYLLFATNNGITAVVGPKGQVLNQVSPFKVAVLTGEIPAMNGTTPIVAYGQIPVLTLIMLLFCVALVRNRPSP